jgi:hypothetical protein
VPGGLKAENIGTFAPLKASRASILASPNYCVSLRFTIIAVKGQRMMWNSADSHLSLDIAYIPPYDAYVTLALILEVYDACD